MSFFSRIGRMFRSAINAVLGRAEAGMTIAQMDTALRDMQMDLNKFKLAVAEAMAHEKRSKRRYDEEKKRVARLTEQATIAARQAVESSSENERGKGEKLAKRALQLRGEAERNLETYKTAWQSARSAAKTARQKFEVASTKLEERARKLKEARIIHQLNESRQELQGLTQSLDIDTAAATFDKGLDRIKDESEKMEALDRLALSEGTQLDEELEKLTSKSDVEAKYAELLAEVSGAPAAAEVETAVQEAPETVEEDPALG